MRKKRKSAKNFIKAFILFFVSVLCNFTSSFLSAKAVTVQEKALIDHLNGNYNSPLVETVYKHREFFGRLLSAAGIVFLLVFITYVVFGFIKIISERKNKRSECK